MKHKQQLFFILLFLLGLGVGAFYLHDFLSHHHLSLGSRITLSLAVCLIVAIVLTLTADFVRAYKSRLLINRMRTASTRTLFKGLSVGYLFNALLPFRLGELVRAYYVGDTLAISKTAVFMSIIIERIVDGFILGLCFVSAAILVHVHDLSAFHILLNIGIGLLILSTLLALAVDAIRSENKFVLHAIRSFSGMFNDKICNRMRFMAWSGIYGTRLMLANRKIAGRYILLSLGTWVLYFGAIVFVALAYFHGLSPTKVWFTTQATYAGLSAPAGPGYIGTFQILVSHLLNTIGLLGTGGFSVLMWLVMVVPISLIGLAVLVRERFSDKKRVTQNHVMINKLYREQNISGELAHFLDAYFKGEKINQILTHAEQENKFKLIKSLRGGSNAHTMLVWQDEEMRIKKIALPQYADKLESQARWLTERAGLTHIPVVVGQEKTEQHYYFDLKYRDEFYPFFDYIHSHSVNDSFKILKKVIRFMDRSIYQEIPARNGRFQLTKYMDEKVLGKANDTASMSNVINKLMGHDTLVINGVTHRNLLQVIDKIKHKKAAMKDLANYNESPIHGDLTIDNLIVDDKGDFLVLDPNDENQVSSKIVDLAKLYQSLHSGYEFLIQLDQCTVKNRHINYEDSKSHKYAELFELFDDKLKKELPAKDYQAILYHEAVHYCRMLTYRVNINPDTVPIFYATAVRLFNDFLNQYD